MNASQSKLSIAVNQMPTAANFDADPPAYVRCEKQNPEFRSRKSEEKKNRNEVSPNLSFWILSSGFWILFLNSDLQLLTVCLLARRSSRTSTLSLTRV